MKQFPVLVFLLFIFSWTANAQTAFTVRGMVQDTMNLKAVPFASVSLIRKADSVLTQFTRTNEKGQFELKTMKPATYVVLVAHNQYVDYVDEVVLNEQNTTLNMGTLPLFQRGQLLK
ncbi:MAG: carboxypeptidase-like regulatory domain-containing protein, partial [Chitinophagaceae bacterium]|nr:carboxypeptidase-like regulatory domain-containing protein [Chitinophagaceae bacterium]